MPDSWQYLVLMALCMVGTLPLEWAFDARVYRRPAALVRALRLPLSAFFAWDAVAVARGHWTFDERYVTGWRLPLDVPIEEVAFFVVIPICAVLSYESCRRILDRGDGQ